MSDEEESNFTIAVDALDGTSLDDATRARLVVEGRAALVIGFAELLMDASGGRVRKATSYSDGEATDITDHFRAEQIDPLATGDALGGE